MKPEFHLRSSAMVPAMLDMPAAATNSEHKLKTMAKILSLWLVTVISGSTGAGVRCSRTQRITRTYRSARSVTPISFRDLQARDDIIGNILQVLHDGTDGIAMSRDENSFGIGLMLASSS